MSGPAKKILARAGLWWILLAGCSALAATAQDDGQDQKIPTLHAYADLVQVPTLVLGKDRRPLPPIPESRFFVSIDGGPKFRVTHARLEGDDPISLAILLDLSDPDRTLMRTIDEVISSLAPAELHDHDRVAVYALDCQLIRAPLGFPVDRDALKLAVRIALSGWKARGEARMKPGCADRRFLWDSIGMVTNGLYQQSGRRVMLVLSDGFDSGSRNSWSAIREYAQERGVAVFGMPEGYIALGYPKDFASLCELTGGVVLLSDGTSPAKQMARFMDLVRGRYIVEFPHPVSTEGGYRLMEITIARSDAFIRPSGISVPLDNPAILNDPNTVRPDPSHAPAPGTHRTKPL